jgi:hypothetical protein
MHAYASFLLRAVQTGIPAALLNSGFKTRERIASDAQ